MHIAKSLEEEIDHQLNHLQSHKAKHGINDIGLSPILAKVLEVGATKAIEGYKEDFDSPFLSK